MCVCAREEDKEDLQLRLLYMRREEAAQEKRLGEKAELKRKIQKSTEKSDLPSFPPILCRDATSSSSREWMTDRLVCNGTEHTPRRRQRELHRPWLIDKAFLIWSSSVV